MPKLLCPCGFVHDLSPCPDDGWLTVPDAKFEDYLDAIKSQDQVDGKWIKFTSDMEEYHKNDRFIADNTGLLYECPNCSRLMWRKPDSNEFIIYITDNPDE